MIDSIIINGIIYNRVEATSNNTCDACHLDEICSKYSNISLVCEYASEGNYIWKTKHKSYHEKNI